MSSSFYHLKKTVSSLQFFSHLQELTVVNHEKIYYAPFRKNFYVEVPEIANMTPAGVVTMHGCS